MTASVGKCRPLLKRLLLLLARPSGVLFDGRHSDMLRPRAAKNASSQQHLSLHSEQERCEMKESSMRATGSHIAASPAPRIKLPQSKVL